jgi:hypothetical protein
MKRFSVHPRSGLASKRQTYKYVTGWNHLDAYSDQDWNWHLLGTGKIAKEDMDGQTVLFTVRASRKVSRQEMALAMSAEFDRGCRCEHDCCGHTQWYVTMHQVRRIKRREWVVPLVGLRNI